MDVPGLGTALCPGCPETVSVELKDSSFSAGTMPVEKLELESHTAIQEDL